MMTVLSEGAGSFDPIHDYDVKAALRIDDDSDDALIANLIAASIAHVEASVNKRLASREVTLAFPCLTDAMQIPLTPVSAITEVKYLDGDGERQTLDPTLYQLTQTTGFPRITRRVGKSYPSVLHEDGSVLVKVTAGYASIDDIPAPLKQAVIVMVCDAYRNPDRPLEAVNNVNWLLSPYRRGEWL